MPFDSETEARRYMTVLGTHRGNIRQALVTLSASRRGVPLVAEVLHEHIDLLTAVSPGQLTRYRHQVRDHMSGARRCAHRRRRQPLRQTVDPRSCTPGHGSKDHQKPPRLFSSAMKTAIRLGYRSSNPCIGTALPKSNTTEDPM